MVGAQKNVSAEVPGWLSWWECVTLDLWVVRSSPTPGMEPVLKKNMMMVIKRSRKVSHEI